MLAPSPLTSSYNTAARSCWASPMLISAAERIGVLLRASGATSGWAATAGIVASLVRTQVRHRSRPGPPPRYQHHHARRPLARPPRRRILRPARSPCFACRTMGHSFFLRARSRSAIARRKTRATLCCGVSNCGCVAETVSRSENCALAQPIVQTRALRGRFRRHRSARKHRTAKSERFSAATTPTSNCSWSRKTAKSEDARRCSKQSWIVIFQVGPAPHPDGCS
jgi:hypothetical protein